MRLNGRRRALTAAAGIIAVMSSACRHDVIEVPAAAHVSTSAHGAGRLTAGAARVDITPPPGPPPFGFSEAAKHDAFAGHRTRLFARAVVVDDPAGGKFGLVALDLGCASFLLLRRVATKVATTGLTADRILLAATHTHSAPAGHHGSPFYDRFGSPGLFTGFDPALADYLVDGIARALREADANRRPARITVGYDDVDALTRNRSIKAHRQNRDRPADAPTVDPRLVVLRVDRADATDARTPLACFCIFAGHPTIIGVDNDLWHGDVHGIAAQLLERRLTKHYGAPCLCPFANGALGDVSFRWRTQSHEEAMRLARALSDRAVALVRALDGTGSDQVAIRHGYLEAELRGAVVEEGTLAASGKMGIPTVGGAEDGRSAYYGKRFLWLGPRVVEGARRDRPSGDHGRKLVPAGFLYGLLAPASGKPATAAIQTIRVGDTILCAIPFEATTETGRRVAKAVATATGADPAHVVPLAPANGYIGYCATAEEYDAQHYEGSSTLYGPRTEAFLRNRFGRVGTMMKHAKPARVPARHFRVDGSHATFPAPGRGTVTRRITDLARAHDQVSLSWHGLDPGRIRPDLGWIIRVEVKDTQSARDQWTPLRTDHDSADDTGLHFALRLRERARSRGWWQATWYLADVVDRRRIYRFRVAARSAAATVTSEPFTLYPKLNDSGP